MENCVEENKFMETLRGIVEELNTDEAFYVADLDDVRKKLEHWKEMLPRVKPFYAVKTNAEKKFLQFLVNLDLGFDCASKDEMEWVLNLGANPHKIIYAHTFKKPSHLRYAKTKGVYLMTFETTEELFKIKKHYPNSKLVLRFQVPNVKSAFPLDNKFGCDNSQFYDLLSAAKHLDLSVVGTSFHVGGLCQDPTAYTRAIETAKIIFDLAKSIGYKLHLLDIGGGFPGHSNYYEEFDKMSKLINEALEKHFPESKELKIIAEPGTYFAGSAFTLCTNILGKKKFQLDGEVEETKARIAYYLNDGIYGSFFHGYEHYNVKPEPLQNVSKHSQKTMIATKLWGYTCCPEDIITEHCFLPEMNVGDYIVFRNMGAYTLSITSDFNGFSKPFVHYLYSDKRAPNQNGIAECGVKELSEPKAI